MGVREIVHPARVERYLDAWRRQNPTFLWAPTTQRGIGADEISGMVLQPRGVVTGYGGIYNPVGGGDNGLVIPSLFGIAAPTASGQNRTMVAAIAVTIEDPTQVRGAFLKIGQDDGIGIGGGSTTFDSPGGRLIALSESVAWHVILGTTGFVRGLNLISVVAGWSTDANAKHLRVVSYTLGSNAGEQLAAGYLTPTVASGIGGYGASGANRQTNAYVNAVAVWSGLADFSYTWAEAVEHSLFLGGPNTATEWSWSGGGAGRQQTPGDTIRDFTPQRIWVPVPGAGTSLPTLSGATYVPGSITSVGFRPRVTAS